MSHPPAIRSGDPPAAPADRSLRRSPGRNRSQRRLFVLAVTSCTLAIGAATMYFVERNSAPTVMLNVTDAVAERPPVTVPLIEEPPVEESPAPVDASSAEPPVDAPSIEMSSDSPRVDVAPWLGGFSANISADSGPDTAARPDGRAEPSPTSWRAADIDERSRRDDELSPLADLLGPRGSAIPEPTEARPYPVSIEIDSIDVTPFAIRDVGLEDDGQLQIPGETEIGWYRYGATSGRAGATVLAAHVSWNKTIGPFFELGSVEPGNRIAVTLDDGTTRHYQVVERTMYDKDELPRERIWRTTGPEELVLITCGGDFNPEIRRYRQNIVVYAVPVA